MKLELDCSWNENKNRAKQSIYFDYRPKSIFRLHEQKIILIQKLAQTAHLEGPSVLDELKGLVKQYPKSLYALIKYHETLQFFEFFDECKQLLEQATQLFPDEVFTKCLIGRSHLANKEHQKFLKNFNEIEVLKGSFPKRREYYFEEALFFHHLWGRYFFESGNEIQAEKHKNLILLIMNTLQSYRLAITPR